MIVEATKPTNSDSDTELIYQWYKGESATDTTAADDKKVSINGTSNELALTSPVMWEYDKTDYYFCVVTNTYQGKTYAATSNVAAVTYAKAEITGPQVISINAPVKNGTPQSTIQVGTDANYSDTITWDKAMTSDGKFAANTVYTASVTLTAKENYQFASGFNPAVAEATVSGGTLNDDGTYSFKAAFDKTSDKKLQGISAELKTPGKAYVYGDTVAESDVTVTATYDTGTETVAGGYTISYDSGNGRLAVGDNTVTVTFGGKTANVAVNNVGKKPITVKANDATRAYGQADPDLTFTVPAGALVGSDKENDLNVNLTCAATATSPVGKVAITGTSNSANYAVTVTPGTLTITKAKVTRVV